MLTISEGDIKKTEKSLVSQEHLEILPGFATLPSTVAIRISYYYFFFLIIHNIYVPISLYKSTLNNHKTFQTTEKGMPLLLLNLMYKMGQITFVNKSDVQRAVQNICYHNIRIAGFFHKPSFRRYNYDLLFVFKHSN